MGYLPKFLLAGVAMSAMPFALPQANAPRRQDNIGLTGTFRSCVSPIHNETCYGNGTHYQMGADLYADTGNNTMKFLYSGAPLLPPQPINPELITLYTSAAIVWSLVFCAGAKYVKKILEDRRNDQANNAPGDIEMNIVSNLGFTGTAPAVFSDPQEQQAPSYNQSGQQILNLLQSGVSLTSFHTHGEGTNVFGVRLNEVTSQAQPIPTALERPASGLGSRIIAYFKTCLVCGNPALNSDQPQPQQPQPHPEQPQLQFSLLPTTPSSNLLG